MTEKEPMTEKERARLEREAAEDGYRIIDFTMDPVNKALEDAVFSAPSAEKLLLGLLLFDIPDLTAEERAYWGEWFKWGVQALCDEALQTIDRDRVAASRPKLVSSRQDPEPAA